MHLPYDNCIVYCHAMVIYHNSFIQFNMNLQQLTFESNNFILQPNDIAEILKSELIAMNPGDASLLFQHGDSDDNTSVSAIILFFSYLSSVANINVNNKPAITKHVMRSIHAEARVLGVYHDVHIPSFLLISDLSKQRVKWIRLLLNPVTIDLMDTNSIKDTAWSLLPCFIYNGTVWDNQRSALEILIEMKLQEWMDMLQRFELDDMNAREDVRMFILDKGNPLTGIEKGIVWIRLLLSPFTRGVPNMLTVNEVVSVLLQSIKISQELDLQSIAIICEIAASLSLNESFDVGQIQIAEKLLKKLREAVESKRKRKYY